MSIEKIEILYAGYCVNNEKRMFKGAGSKNIRFPAACVLLRHSQNGYVLFDTGYSCENNRMRGFVGFLYENLNPHYIDPETELVQILARKGIAQSEIKLVLLSHIHPDHIGGLKAFESAKYMISEAAYQEYKRPKLKSLVFSHLFPEDFPSRAIRVSADGYYDDFFSETCDIFGDKSALLVPLDGHAKGQMGLYLPQEKILFAADACWRTEYLPRSKDMRAFPKFLQADYGQYVKTQAWLNAVYQRGIRVIYSHDAPLQNGEIK